MNNADQGLLAVQKRILLTLAMSFLLFGCADTQLRNYRQVFKERGQPPVIVDYYAAEVIRPGATWKIFLHANDEDGDMQYIAFTLFQSGFGYYSTDYTWLRGTDRRELAGYVILRTPVDRNLTVENFTLEVLVRDRQRNRSATIKLPLRFDYGQKEIIPEEWQVAAKHRLGALVTDIRSLEQIGEGSGS